MPSTNRRSLLLLFKSSKDFIIIIIFFLLKKDILTIAHNILSLLFKSIVEILIE